MRDPARAARPDSQAVPSPQETHGPTSHGTPAAVWVAARLTRREVKTWSAAFPMCSAPIA